MESHVGKMIAGREGEKIWLLQHPPLYTIGARTQSSDILHKKFPIHKTSRGGLATYHGPGQRVVYLMLNLKERGLKARPFVRKLEDWLILALARLGAKGERRHDRIGIWIADKSREDKIAAIGIRVRRGISFHGVSVNVNPDLSHYDGIVPCGIARHGVTSLHALGIPASMREVDQALQDSFADIF